MPSWFGRLSVQADEPVPGAGRCSLLSPSQRGVVEAGGLAVVTDVAEVSQ